MKTLKQPTRCAACAAHYGDEGTCDEGKPLASPHRAYEAYRKALAAYRAAAARAPALPALPDDPLVGPENNA